MIPVSLTLQNFLSYGSQPHTVEFGPYRLICLSGKNGHGKSALLDALTWALWGQARKTTGTSKPDEGLLRIGQTDMVVSLDFIFNGQYYRVRRLFSTKYGKPSTHVDFGTYNPQDNYFSPLTEKTIKKTQDLIEQVLGLDYEAFINSSFLRQGQANEFSKKSPKDRKDIIATILGLNHYEKARKLAADKAKESQQSALQLEKIIEHLDQSCQTIPVVQENLASTQITLTLLQTQEQTLDQQISQLKKEQLTHQQHAQELLKITHEREQLTQEHARKRADFMVSVQAWKERHRLLLRREHPAELAAQQQALETELQKLLEQKQELLSIKEQILIKKTEYQTISAQLDQVFQKTAQDNMMLLEQHKQEQYQLEKKLHELEKQEQEKQKEIITAEHNIEELRKQADPSLLVADTATLKITYERAKEFYQRWLEQGKWVAQQLQQLETKKGLSHDQDNPSCPLCEQNLSQARKRFLQKKFVHEESFLTHRLHRLRRLLLDLKKQLEDMHRAIAVAGNLDATLLEQIKIIQEHQTLVLQKNQLIEQLTLQKELVTKEQQRYLQTEQDHVTRKHQNPLLQALTKDLKELEQTCMRYQNIDALHTTCHQKLTQLKQQRTISAQYDEQKKELHEQLSFIHQQALTIRTLEKQLEHLQTTLNTLAHSTQVLEKLTTEITALSQELMVTTQNKELLLQKKGGLEKQLLTLQEQTKLKQEQSMQQATFEQTAQQYATIAQAFSKDGIQALLIEDALPEIEQEANDLLSRLTDNQAHIFIESLRDLKRGGVRETMDINISDSSGIRPYEMFSGGEAFRIDFSLRIAISKLLARRAGTSLQTLIIDEGFGSQDEEGLTRIMDALYKIQDDFEKIIIVSHLSAMKEQFPVQFQVEKGPHGSRINILEQG